MALLDNVKAVLKISYEEGGVQSLLGRPDPLVSMIKKEQRGGKVYSYLNVSGRSPAVASNKKFASQIAASQGTKNTNWEMPLIERQLFGTTVVTQKEMLSSPDKKSAFQAIAENLEFGTMAGIRRQLAAALYSSGKGEFGVAPAGGTLNVGNNTIVLPRSAVVAIDVGTQFQFGGTTGVPAANASVNVVTGIGSAPAGSKAGSATVTFTASAADTYASGDYMVYLGNHDGTIAIPGNVIAPHGLKSLFPSALADRNTVLYGIDRSVYPDRLCGRLVDDSALAAATNTKIATINKAVNEARQAGVENGDLKIVLSANDYVDVIAETKSQERYWQSPSDSAKGRNFKFGIDSMAFAMASTWLDDVIDTPFLEDGLFYILDMRTLKFVSLSNLKPLETNEAGASTNAPGTENPMAEPVKSNEAMRINIDDIFSLIPASETVDGDGVMVTANLFVDLCTLRPSANAVGLFPAA